MAKIAVIGICGNSYFLQVDHFHEKGETIIARGYYEEIGGKGINQAIACARMGAEVSFLAAVGDDTDGKKCVDVALQNGLRSHIVVREKEKTTFAFILTDKFGENRVTAYHGAVLGEQDVLDFEKEIAESDFLLLQHEVPAEVNEVAVFLAKKHGTRIILNPAPIRAISEEMARSIFVVTPNEQEQVALKGLQFQNTVVTLGDKGCMINHTAAIPAINVKAVDTTGAGDTFNGVMAVCLAEGMSLEDACRYGVIASGLSVSKPYVLNAIPHRDEVERML